MTSDPTDDTNGNADTDNDGILDWEEKHPESVPRLASIYNKMNETEIQNQFNPFVKENIPPVLFENGMAIESEGHISPLKASWAHIKVRPSDVGGIAKVEVRIKGWMLDYVEIYDEDGDGWYEGKLEISYAIHYLFLYVVEVRMTDSSNNILEFEMEQEGALGGVVKFIGKLWDAMVGGIIAAWEAVKSAVNFIWEWIENQIMKIFKPIIDKIMAMIDEFGNKIGTIINRYTNSIIPIGYIPLVIAEVTVALLSDPLIITFIAMAISLYAIEAIISYMTGTGPLVGKFLQQFMVSLLFTVMLGILAIEIKTVEGLKNLGATDSDISIIDGWLTAWGFSFAVMSFVLGLFAALKEKGAKKGIKESVGDILGFSLSAIGLLLVLSHHEDPYINLYLDMLGIGLGVFGAIIAFKGMDAKSKLLIATPRTLFALSLICLVIDVLSIITTDYGDIEI